MTGQLIQLSRHSHKCPRNAITMKTAYSVLNNGNYLGRDFALAEAMKTIDRLKSGESYES